MSLTSDVDWYILGDYRAYSPILMRFHSPDAASPFGHGGLNAYVYCSGNPVNRSDPSGEGWLEWLFVGIGAVASGIGMVLSAGTLAPALVAAVTLSANLSQAASVGLLAVDLASVGLDIASAKAMDDGNDALAMKLSLGSAVLGHAMFSAAAATAVAPLAAKAFTRGPRYVQAAPVVSPLALKAPSKTTRLRGGADFTAGGEVQLGVGGATRRDDDLRGLGGIELVNRAAISLMDRRRIISGGFSSSYVLNEFRRGINLRNRQSVIYARDVLSRGLLSNIPDDQPGLNPARLARSGFDANELARLNPSLATVSGETARTMDVVREVVRETEAMDVSEAGEQIYHRFLQAPSMNLLGEYAIALMRARANHRWQGWNG
jgi:RHS repeat-associated protein